MSILTALLEHKITWDQAKTEAEQWAENLVAHDSTLTATTGALLSDVKQAASNAIDMADTALGAVIGPAATATETALDAALAAATKGVSTPFNIFINDGIDRIAGAIKAEADAWSLKAKAQLASTAPAAAPASPVQPVS